MPVYAVSPTWSSEQYTASVQGEEFDGFISGPNVMDTEPPLPITASDSAYYSDNIQWDISSTITSSQMDFSLATSLGTVAHASGEFSGNYISSASNPFFKFTYTFTKDPAIIVNNSWLTVTDLTSATNLYTGTLSLSNSPLSVLVQTTPGHDISVSFGVENYKHWSFSTAPQNATVSYSLAVVPEPVSTTLFLTGGILLAGRRYIKRKAG
jgi:hypothetical protein